jgi:lysozyme
VVAYVYLPQVIKLCPGIDGPDRLAALIDFAYNLGGNALKNSTLRRKINAGEWDAVPDQLRRWDKAGGRVLRGLTIRRNAEAGLI